MTSNVENRQPHGQPSRQPYRLPAATCLGPVRLQVADLDRSAAWYDRVLGLVKGAGREPGVLSLGAGPDSAALVELVERPGARPVPRRGRLGLYHYALVVPDRRSLGGVVRRLAEVEIRIGAADHLVSEALYLTDPDGFGVEVYADRPRSSWRYHDTAEGRELQMTTDPLSLDGLAELATGPVGLPAGTTMGHVHLHVGSLDGAATFYGGGLGLERTVWTYPGALFLAAGGYHHHLGVNTWAGAGATAPAEDEARLVRWRVVVPAPPDVRAAAASIGRAGGAVTLDDRGAALAADPWGTAVSLEAG